MVLTPLLSCIRQFITAATLEINKDIYISAMVILLDYGARESVHSIPNVARSYDQDRPKPLKSQPFVNFSVSEQIAGRERAERTSRQY